MKVSELQIGDFVQCYNRYEKVSELVNTHPASSSPYKISTEYAGGFFHRKEEEVKPIPLTEEILDNAFLKDSREYAEWYFGKCREPNVWRFEITETLNDISVNISYVHELQHALRLIGLDELADNLKI